MEPTNKQPLVTLGVAIASAIFLVIGFATPFWSRAGQSHSGLWQICRPQCVTVPAFVKGTDGYITQIIFTVGFLLAALSLISLLVYLIPYVISKKRPEQAAPLVISIVFGICSALVNLGGVLLIAIVLGAYLGASSLSYLGFSFAFVCVSGGLQIISVVLSIIMSCSRSQPEAYPGQIVMAPYQAKY